jgi:hypothetical protein
MAPVALARRTDLFFGNSYTYFNGGGMELMVKKAARRSFEHNRWLKPVPQAVQKLPRHLKISTEPTRRRGKRDHRQPSTGWDLEFVLQDQSAVPAFVFSDLWYDSLEAGVELNSLATTGAVTMFPPNVGSPIWRRPGLILLNYLKMQIPKLSGYGSISLSCE